MDRLNLERQLPRWLFTISLVLIVNIFNLYHSTVVQAQQVPGKAMCRYPSDIGTNITFLAFLPCFERADSRGDGLDTASSLLEECDLLTRAAVSLAVERLNQDKVIMANHSLSVASLSRAPGESRQSTNILLEDLINAFSVQLNLNDLFGVIGPRSLMEERFWAPIFQRFNLPAISYDITDTGADQESSFYRSLPSDREANIGRLVFMAKFEWFRIAIITSNETYYAQSGKDFMNMYSEIVRQYDPNGELSLLTRFSNSPDLALNEIKFRDINIIFGFFDARNARKVLCKAGSKGLISNNHVWILPSYYNPNWWKINDKVSLKDDECSNEEVGNALESTIFIDTVKFPPIGLSLNDFHNLLLAKALDLFPSLTEEDLNPYLLHSRATNAYDAVTLLAQSVGVAFGQGGDSCINTSLVQVALEKDFMYCEYCRLNSGCFINANETKQCEDICGTDNQFIPNREQILQSQPDFFHRDYLLNEFGQILYSQFIEGDECPVALLWHSGHGPIGNLNNFATIEELDQIPCTARLNITNQNFAREGSTCPQTFQWKGSSGPPHSAYLSLYRISIEEIILISIFTGFGLLVVALFLIINIVWRNNKIIKATSPWLNVVFLVGVIIRLPTTMLQSLAISTIGYNFSVQAMTPLCNLIYWSYYIGEGIFLSALIMKNWRIYRLFHNKNLKRLGKWYSDIGLVVGVLCLQIPIVITLIIQSTLFHLRLEVSNLMTENLVYVSFSFCTSNSETVFETILTSYNAALLLVLLVIAFLNTLVHLSVFRREGLHSFQAAAIIFIPIMIFTIVQVVLRISSRIVFLRIRLWMEFTLGVLLSTLTLAVLFGPNVWLLIKTKRSPSPVKNVTSRRDQSLTVPHVSHYHQLLSEKEMLKKELAEINEKISKLSTVVIESRIQHESSPSQPKIQHGSQSSVSVLLLENQ